MEPKGSLLHSQQPIQKGSGDVTIIQQNIWPKVIILAAVLMPVNTVSYFGGIT
jgi:hypothetical protein